jgi:hypothetical protein
MSQTETKPEFKCKMTLKEALELIDVICPNPDCNEIISDTEKIGIVTYCPKCLFLGILREFKLRAKDGVTMPKKSIRIKFPRPDKSYPCEHCIYEHCFKGDPVSFNRHCCKDECDFTMKPKEERLANAKKPE